MGLVLEAFEAFSSGVFLLQEAFCMATPICTTVVQIKRARLENASRTTHPETHL